MFSDVATEELAHMLHAAPIFHSGVLFGRVGDLVRGDYCVCGAPLCRVDAALDEVPAVVKQAVRAAAKRAGQPAPIERVCLACEIMRAQPKDVLDRPMVIDVAVLGPEVCPYCGERFPRPRHLPALGPEHAWSRRTLHRCRSDAYGRRCVALRWQHQLVSPAPSARCLGIRVRAVEAPEQMGMPAVFSMS